MECTLSFHELLSAFQCVFTEPTFPIFASLMTGWCCRTGGGSSRSDNLHGSVHKGHHSRYHRFFSKSRGAWTNSRECSPRC